MDHNHQWNCLGWNIRGINSQPKWDVICRKVQESCHSIICLQETERECFDEQYLKQFCPRNLNYFEFSPLVGASGGLITFWNNNLFDGVLVLANTISVTVKPTFKLSGQSFHVTNIYGLADPAAKAGFISCLYDFDTSSFRDWLILGDFNIIRPPNNRSRPGGNPTEMLFFNDLIQHLDLVEISF
jgi:hypothetical protein